MILYGTSGGSLANMSVFGLLEELPDHIGKDTEPWHCGKTEPRPVVCPGSVRGGGISVGSVQFLLFRCFYAG